MKAIFLGTGAAEGIPALYCRCSLCEKARKNGKKDIRTRSAFRIGEHYQIDLPPETFSQMIKNKINMYGLEHILITHSHLDHFQFELLFEKVMAKKNNGKPVNIYLSRQAWAFYKKIVAQFEKTQTDKRIKTLWNWVTINTIKPYKIFKAGDFTVQAIVGNHRAWGKNEFAFNYLISVPHGNRILYAVDTGYYGEQTWKYLVKIKMEKINILIMECTFGSRKDRGKFPESHLDIGSYIKMIERMSEIGIIDRSTKIYVTHINPHHGMLHSDLSSFFEKVSGYDITVAYDGLSINV